MTPHPVVIEQGQTLRQAAEIMAKNDFRHLPVVKCEKTGLTPLGMISVRDIIQNCIGKVKA